MAWVHGNRDVPTLRMEQTVEPLHVQLRCIGLWLAEIWAAGSQDVVFPPESLN